MNLLPIVDMIESKGYAEQGKTLFINAFPADVRNGVLLRERLTGARVTPELPGYLQFGLQVIIRGTSYGAAEELAKDIVKSLRTEQEVEVSGVLFKHIRMQHLPVPYPLSDGELIEFNTTFDVCCVDPTWA